MNTQSVAYHFKTNDHCLYHLFPIDFTLQVLLIEQVKTEVFIGDIILNKSELPNLSEHQILSNWFASASLQTKDPNDLIQSFVIWLPSIPPASVDVLHLSLAQTDQYLGKVEISESTMHKYLYHNRLVAFGVINISEFIFNAPNGSEEYDKGMFDRISSYGYSTRLAEAHELIALP